MYTTYYWLLNIDMRLSCPVLFRPFGQELGEQDVPVIPPLTVANRVHVLN